MAVFREKLCELLPGHLRDLVSVEWVPWTWVRQRHTDLPKEQITALFEAYRHLLSSSHPVEDLASRTIPGETRGCIRCGSCCACLLPGPVSRNVFRFWSKQGMLMGKFVAPGSRGFKRIYTCWYFEGVRLRMCPLLHRNLTDGKAFCSVYHLGSAHRHPACVRYRPGPPLCEITQPELIW